MLKNYGFKNKIDQYKNVIIDIFKVIIEKVYVNMQ